MKLILDTTVYGQSGTDNKKQEVLFQTNREIENELLNLYPHNTYQEFEGFGGALTDSAGFVYAQMSETDKERLLEAYFGETGLGYCMARIPIDSCDFSVEQFQAVNDSNDMNFNTFSLEREKQYIYPLWKDVESTLGKPVEIMITPWSPPEFMKTNGERCRGGSLKPEYRKAYAVYICRYIKELKELVFDIKRLTVQNEPKAVQTWDSCVVSAEEEKIFIRDYLYPTMKENEFTDIEIFIWDHNKERAYERACAIIDETTEHIIKGIAFHWYSGDHFEALELIKRKFPDKKLILSEACIEYSKYQAEAELDNVKKYAHDIIGNLNAGMNAFYDWNIVLDEKGGPNHVENFCDAPFLYHMDSHKLEERDTFSAIGHFSKFIKPGAVRIAYSKYTDEFEITAFKNMDGTIVFVAFNKTDKTIPVTVRIGDNCAGVTLQAFSLNTGVVE